MLLRNGKKASGLRKFISLLLVFLLLMVFFGVFNVIGFGPTVVSVSPISQTVSPYSTFDIDVNCVPGQPIKSFEFKFCFDPSLLQVNSVSEGDIFNGYSTFFNSGTIDNIAGSVTDVYGLITGVGNVTSTGSFVVISVTAKGVSGVSSIDLYDVGVTNESEYVSITVDDGSVEIDATPPVIVDNSPSMGTTGDSFVFNVIITDNVDNAGELSVMVNWSHGSEGGNDSMNSVGGDFFEKTISLDLNSVSNMVYFVYTNDSYGNVNTSSSMSVLVSDNDNPNIIDISASPSVQVIDGYVNITSSITDNIGIGSVFLNVSYPDSSFENFSITGNRSGNIFYCNKSYSITGSYSYFVLAKDTSDNAIVSSVEVFVINDISIPEVSNVDVSNSNPLDTDSSFGWVNISCDVTDDNAVDMVFLRINNPGGSWNNVSMIQFGVNGYYYNSSISFSQFGNYSYFIWANDTSNNVGTSVSYDFSMSPNWDVDMNGECKVFDLTLISNHYNESGNPGWIREDVDNNGKIQVLDLVLVSNHYNETWWL